MKSPRIRLALTEFLRTEPGHAQEISDANDELVEIEARVVELARLIADDGFAMTFQSMGQYRSALLKALKG